MKRTSVTIIGMGPRGLALFERIAACARASRCPIRLNLVEPNECGPGAHSPRLPPHLLANSVAGEVTAFPFAAAAAMPAAAKAAPSLLEWARAHGYRRCGAQFVQAGAESGAEVADSDYLPHQLLGRYLAWAYTAIAAALPSWIEVSHVRQRAFDMYQQPDGSFVVECENGFPLMSDFVFLATGHSPVNLTDEEAWCRKFAQDHARYNHKLAYIRHVYPLDKLVAIGSDAAVAIQGLGLVAHDVVAELTAGRGGRFVEAGAGLRYLRSGQEPQLLLFSRSCLPAAARPVQAGLGASDPARFFTSEAVRALRRHAAGGNGAVQLDFERQLLPLLTKEMGFAWRTVQDGAPPDPGRYQLGAQEAQAIDALLFPLRGRSFADPAGHAAFFARLLADDLHEARRGPPGSAAKAIAAVLREAGAVLRECIEHAGLTPASHRKFMSVYHPVFKRIAFGLPLQRNEQLRALIEAGVLKVAAGPNAAIRIDEDRSQFALHTRLASSRVAEYTEFADVLVVARSGVYSPETDATPLMCNLMKRGTVRPYYNGSYHPGGIDIDAASHPLDRAGRALPNLWAVGYLAQGAQFCMDALPCPRMPSRQVHDAQRCVRELFGAIEALASKGQRHCRAGAADPAGQAQPATL